MQRRRADHGRRLSHEDHVEIQRRVSEGETFASAAAAVGCSTKSIQRFMARTGGMRPRSRARSPLRLSLADREELSRGLMAGESLRQIAARLGRAASTISREVAWNGHRDTYRAWRAEKTAARRARRPKREKLATHPRLCCEVERRLRERWSPQQIAARLVCDYPDDLEMRVSHETIYRSLFVQTRGALRKELTACLRTGRTQRRSHKRSEHSGTGRLRDMVLISDRPAGAADRAVPGHWEGDLMVGTSVPEDYDVQLNALRRHLDISQAGFARLVGAAGKAVVYQWEARKRTPSPLFWQRIIALRVPAVSPSATGDRPQEHLR